MVLEPSWSAAPKPTNLATGASPIFRRQPSYASPNGLSVQDYGRDRFFARSMAAAGIELVAIMHAGGWKSPDIVMRYIEHMDVQKSGMARLQILLY